MPPKKRKAKALPSKEEIANTEELRMALLQTGERDIDSAEWLLKTWEGRKYCRSGGMLELTLNSLRGFEADAAARKTALLEELREQLEGRERVHLSERWSSQTIEVETVNREAKGLCVKLRERSAYPAGATIECFLPSSMGDPGVLESSGKVKEEDVIIAVGYGENIYPAPSSFRQVMMMLLMEREQSMQRPPGETSPLSIILSRFHPAPQAEIDAAKARAKPMVDATAQSPYVNQYAWAPHTPNMPLWLLNTGTAITQILAPFEREKELSVLLDKQGRSFGALCDAETIDPKYALLKLWDLFTIPVLLQKFRADGEIGRGRNKTSLNNAKQVVRAVVTELTKADNAAKQAGAAAAAALPAQ
jgi:hypothetical protein